MRGEVMVRIGKLKNISAKGKLKDVFDFVDDIMESGEKLVLFGHLKEVIGKFRDRYPDAVSITGDDSMASRQISVDAFQNDPKVKLALCSIQAAGVGLTLTASSRVAFVELGWHSAIHDQCEDRCHRIGQTDSVQCTYFLGKDTIDEWVYKIIEDKRSIASAVTDSDDVVEVNVIDNFINLFNQKAL
jgi:SWI/SNF-related matrix-associated actin-dependent regulator 1 of chromatin subfamily A